MTGRPPAIHSLARLSNSNDMLRQRRELGRGTARLASCPTSAANSRAFDVKKGTRIRRYLMREVTSVEKSLRMVD